MYLTIIKWVALGFLILALLGIPIVYHNRKVSAAFEQGKQVAEAACLVEKAKALQEYQNKVAEIINQESKKADQLQIEKDELDKKAQNAQRKLTEALSKTPIPVGCIVNSNVTDILRDIAGGNFPDSESKGDAFPHHSDPKMPEDHNVPREKGINPA